MLNHKMEGINSQYFARGPLNHFLWDSGQDPNICGLL